MISPSFINMYIFLIWSTRVYEKVNNILWVPVKFISTYQASHNPCQFLSEKVKAKWPQSVNDENLTKSLGWGCANLFLQVFYIYVHFSVWVYILGLYSWISSNFFLHIWINHRLGEFWIIHGSQPSVKTSWIHWSWSPQSANHLRISPLVGNYTLINSQFTCRASY